MSTQDKLKRRVDLIGVSSGRGGHDHRSGLGPNALEREGVVSWVRDAAFEASWREIRPKALQPEQTEALDVVVDVCSQLAEAVRLSTAAGALPVVLGGDHSCAIGTWNGVYAALNEAGPLGLLWIDAHMDSHTPESSPSGNYHGMPVAHLLGHGAPELIRLSQPGPPLLPQHTCLVGVRSFEPEEPALLARVGVRVYLMDEVRRRGLETVLREALAVVSRETAGYGISLDLDALDPIEVPGTGSPVADGIRTAELIPVLGGFAHSPRLLGVEIAEFNPALDRGGTTVAVIRNLLLAVLSGG